MARSAWQQASWLLRVRVLYGYHGATNLVSPPHALVNRFVLQHRGTQRVHA
jgi:hypothetical protein